MAFPQVRPFDLDSFSPPCGFEANRPCRLKPRPMKPCYGPKAWNELSYDHWIIPVPSLLYSGCGRETRFPINRSDASSTLWERERERISDTMSGTFYSLETSEDLWWRKLAGGWRWHRTSLPPKALPGRALNSKRRSLNAHLRPTYARDQFWRSVQ